MVLYAVFAMLLGLDHLMSMATVFVPICRLKVLILAVTAAVSLTLAALTAGKLFNIHVQPDGEPEGK